MFQKKYMCVCVCVCIFAFMLLCNIVKHKCVYIDCTIKLKCVELLYVKRTTALSV